MLNHVFQNKRAFYFLVTLSILTLSSTQVRAWNDATLEQKAGISDSEFQKIKNGKIHTKLNKKKNENIGTATIVGIVPHKIEEVWHVLITPQYSPELYSGVLENEVRYNGGRIQHNYSLIDYPWPFSDRWTINKIDFNRDAWEVSWKRIDGTIPINEGHWHLFPMGDKTLILYQLRVDPGIALLPDWVVNYAMKKKAPEVITGLNRFFKNHGPQITTETKEYEPYP